MVGCLNWEGGLAWKKPLALFFRMNRNATTTDWLRAICHSGPSMGLIALPALLHLPRDGAYRRSICTSTVIFSS